MKLLIRLLIVCLTAPAMFGVEVSAEFHLELADVCVVAEDPGVCMKSYGFICHQIGMPSKSLDAYVLGCNLELADGQVHFVQMLNDNGEWAIEVQKTSTPEPYIPPDPTENSGAAMTEYIMGQMESFKISGNGGTSLKNHRAGLDFATGHWRNGEQVVVRSLCAIFVDELLDERLAADAKATCEELLLRGIQIRSQYSSASPYRAAGANEISWERTTVTLASGDTALVLDGRYAYFPEQTPCRWCPDCCTQNGVLYFDSCRIPSEEELQTAQSCISDSVQLRSEEYYSCLQGKGVKTRCEDQADGSRLCY